MKITLIATRPSSAAVFSVSCIVIFPKCGEADSALEGAGFEPSVPLTASEGEVELGAGSKNVVPRAHRRAGPRVRIHLPPAESLRTIGASAAERNRAVESCFLQLRACD